MSALPPAQMRALRDATHSDAGGQPGFHWADLQAKAEQIAHLAAISPATGTVSGDRFDAMMAEATPWQRELAMRGIEDVAALLRPGMQALATLVERGAATEAPALALWREYHQASEAVLSALAPHCEAA